MTTHSPVRIQLIAQVKDKSKSPKTFELTKGIGDSGQTVRIIAETSAVYELRDVATQKGPQGIRARRSGRNLEIFLEGSVEPDAVIEGYYDEALIEFPKDSLTGVTNLGDPGIYVIDEGLRPALTTLTGETTPIMLLDNAAYLQGWQWGIAAGAGAGVLSLLRGGSEEPAPAAPTVRLEAASDNGVSNSDRVTSINTPMLSGTGKAGNTITIKDASGSIIATTQVKADGTWNVATAALQEGVQTLSVAESSPSGKTSQPATIELTITGDLTIVGSVTAGPTSEGVTLFAYDDQSNELGSAAIQSNGTFSILAPTRGSYRGAVLLKAVDSNGAGNNYLDEVTAANKNLGTTLRAMGVAQEGRTQFTISNLDAQLEIHITPVTELAVIKAGVTSNVAPANLALVDQTHQAVAGVLGLNGINITAAPVATNSSSFNGADGLSDAEKYGLLLTKLSGLDSLNGGSVAITLKQLAQNINTSGTGAITAEGAAMVDQGRQQALAALKNAPSTAEKTFTTDSTLNRQLLGDIIVQAQTLDANGKLAVSGTALPDSTVSITFPDGSTGSAVANSSGVFTLTSAAVQPTLDIPLKITGADGLTQPAAMTPPSAPVIATGNGKIVSGTGTPGSTVIVKDAAGNDIGTAVVDVLGQWSFVPATPLANNAVLRALAQDSSGNVSGPGAGIVDVDQVSVRLAEAADGYINAAEKASGGINLDIGLPPTAQVGDSVTTVVTLPDGSTLTLVDVLTAADITAGTITRTLTPTQLATDGLYNAGISLVTQVGQSVPVRQSFIVDATAPAAPVVSPSNGQIINGTAEVGSFVTVKDGSGNVIGTVGPVGTDGNWTLLPAQPLPDGIMLKATATDVAGNTSAVGSNNVDVDALLITGAIDSVGPQLGLMADGSVTNDTSPQLAGTLGTALMPGQTLAVYRKLNNATLDKVGTADINGTAWTFQDGTGTGLTAPLADGNYTYQVVVESGGAPVAGLTPSGFFDITVDTARPAAPATTVPEATAGDAYINAAEKTSDAGAPIVTQLAANARVGDVVTTTVTLPDGSSRVLSTTLKLADVQAGSISQLLGQSALGTDGAYSVSTTITSAINGLVSVPTVNSFTLDTSPPAAGTGALASISDTGTVGDNKTNNSTPALSGMAEANATVQVTVNGQTYTVTANGTGAWTLPATAMLPDGTYTPVIKVTDAAGNSTTGNGTPFTVDATAPAIPGVTIPDATRGVSTAEAADGVALVITLPNDAVAGDTLTTVVTKPDGSTLTLTRVLTDADILAGQYSQTVPQSELLTNGSATQYRDGTWTTSTTLTDTAGNTSPAQTDGFELSANAPTLTLATTAGDGIVNALEKTGDLPVSGSTSAEVGQPVTVQLMSGSTVLGTYYTVVKADGSFALNIPQADLPADGIYTLTADVSNFAGTPAAQATQPVTFDTTAPTISVTSVAGNAVTGSQNGEFSAAERGPLNDNTVDVLPVISGTTDAEVGQTVTLTLNGKAYTTTVLAGGTWSYTLSNADALALNHGSTYAITASVKDVAGNAGSDTDNSLIANIANPDIPTVVELYTGSHTPTITGRAQKDAGGGSYIALANGDLLTVTVNSATYTLTVGGTSSPTGLSYNSTNSTWSLVPASIPNGDHNVTVSVTAGSVTQVDISTTELHINDVPSAITLNAISGGTLNASEENQPLPITGSTNAPVGSAVTVNIGGADYPATVQVGGTFTVTVPGNAVAALVDGTQTVTASVVNRYGVTGTDTETLIVDTTAPSAPTVALPEAPGGISALEAANGTPLVVTLPADARVGDTVTTVVLDPNGGSTVLTHVIQASELPAAQGGTATGTGPFTISQTIPSTALTVDGPWTTSTTLTDTAGNTSVPQPGAFVLDTVAPGVPGVALPEAANGVNAAEALSNGGTPLNVTLPGDAGVGDTVTTVVTLPTGGTLTLTTVLTAADITAGAISQLIPTSALTQDGTWTTSTTVADLAGNASAPRTGSFVLDTTPPPAPAAALAPASDSGTVGDSITADNTPSISGTGTAGDTITVTFPGGEVKTAVVAADGTWSVTPTVALADGVNTVTVTATDPAGNVSAPTALPITIDTTVPAAPAAALATVSDTGNTGDSKTNDTTPTLSGTGTPGDTITIKDAAGTTVGTAVVDVNGNWSTSTSTLAEGLNALSVTATDKAGNTGPAAALPITIDTTGPAAPAAALAPASDSSTKLDGITSDATPTISGTGTPGDTITVTFPGGEVQTVVVANNGTWSVTPSTPLADGLNNISVTATDPAGNTSAPTTVPVTIDTTPPAAPLADVAAASDTGASNSDNITSDTTPTISGAGAPGDTITVTFPGGEVKTAVVAADGTWSVTPTTALGTGLNNITVTATDPAGNTSAATTVSVTIDTTAPLAPTVSAQATNDSTPVISGTATLGAGETLTVTVNGATYNVTVGAGGVWSLNTGTTAPVSGTLGAFVDGQTYPVIATVTDAAGNATSDTTTGELHYDTTAPSVPTVNPLATNDSTPVITGTANLLAGETLTVTVNGATYNVTVATNGTWRLDTGATTPASGTLGAFVNGTSYPVVATITDAANNSTSDTSTNELLFDTTAPSAPAGDVAAASDTGISATDNITSDTTPTIVGTGTAGDTITLYAPNGTTVIGTAVVDAAGNWAITSTALPQGTSALQITATDLAGNTSVPGTVSVTIDTTAPAAPAAVLDPSSDTGTLGDSTTKDNTPTLSGTGVTGDTITIKDAAGNVITTAVVAADGTWSATPTTALPNGLNALSVTATDLAGNVSQPTALPITIDTTAPGAPAAALASSSDTGIVGDAKTADTTPTLTGTGTPGDTITVKDASGNVIATATVAPDGSWSATPTTPLADGVYNLQVTATDPAGNTSAPTTVPVTIDATAPNAPTPDVAAASDTGSSSTDNITSDTTPTISGTGNAGDTITLYAPNGTTVLGTAVVDGSGNWAITPTTALPDGTTSLSVTATDLQGNTSAPGTLSITIDTTAPAAPAAALDSSSDTGNPGDSKTNDTTPTLSGTGTPGDTITIKNAAGTTVGTAVVDANGNWSTSTSTLAEGLNALSVTATDPAGNTSAPTALPITVDTTVAAPVIAPTNGVGAVSGTGEPGATVTIKNAAGTVLGTAVVDASGNWSLTPTSPVPNGTVLSATQTDLAGNASTPGTSTVDTSVPVINPTNGVVLTGTGKPGDTITLTVGGTVLRDASGAPLTAVVDANGNWTATPGAPVPDGTVVTATASYDADNNPATAPVVRSVTDSTTVDALPPPAPVASLALASDSGRVGDGLTNNTTPTLSGAGASPGDTITLYAPDGTIVLGTAVVAADGTWSIPVPTPLSNGTHNFKLTATDPVGNTSAPTTLPVTIDTSAPAAPTVALATSSDSGTLGDGITSDNTPTLTGTGTPGDTITVRDAAGTVIATATVAANGSWSATPATALPEGLNTLSITATDPAGNTGPAASLPLTIDTTAPAAPTAVLASSSDSGTLGDGITNDTTPTLSGTGTPGDTITIKDAAGNVVATAVVGSGGTWTATPTSALPEGLNTLSITATDPAGNTGPATALPITIDTTGPAAPAAVLAPVSDSGKLGDSTTSDTTPTLSGTGMPGDTITIKNAAGTVIATATVAPDGTWSATPTTALPEGVNTLSITATDPAGNTGAATTLPITIDTTAPAAPSAALASSSDTGTVGDGKTNDNTPTLSGTGNPGDTITIQDAAGNIIATAVVGANGQWSATTSTLPDGVNNLSVTATDPAGNTSAPTALPITVDTSIGPVSIAASNGVGAITGTGEPGATLTLKDSATGAVIGTITVAPDGSWSVPLTTSLPDGTILSAIQTDAAGNTSSPDTETINTAIPVLAPSNGTAITGTGKPGNTISVTGTNGAVIGTAVVDANGNWSLTPTSALPDGTVVTATDTSSGLTDTTTVDATPPALPVGDVAASSDTGTSNTDNLTSDTTPTITGTGTPGDTIKLYASNGTTLLGTAVVDASGNWAITPTTALGEGAQALKLTASDPLGNTSAQATVNVTIDSLAPAAPTATLSSASDSGTLGDNITNDTTPTLSGTGEAGATITIKDAAGNVLATAVVAANGTWSATTSTLPEGVNALSITATDAAGNTSAPTALSLTIDTTAPAIPAAPDMTAATDLGASPTDNNTKDSTPDLAVTAPPAGGSLVLYVDGVAVAATYNATTGTLTPNVALTDGAHSLTYAVVDAAGNASAQSAALSVNIDTAAPAQPAAPDMTAATDSGSSTTDNNTKDSTPTFTVTAPPAGVSLVLYVDGNPVAATYDATTGTLTPNVALTDGAHTITYTATDAAGNVSTASTALAVTIDTQAPSAPGGTLAASSDSGTVGDGETNDATPTITGSGATPGDTITLYAPDGTTVLGTGVVDGSGNWSVTPTASLPNGAQTLQITATDPAGNASAPSTLTLTIASTPATFSGDTALAITESNTAQTVNGTLVITDEGSASTVVAQTNVNGSAGLGKFTINAAGAWSYTMNTAQDAMTAGQLKTDTLTVSAEDGTTQVLTVTITGTNDQPTSIGNIYYDGVEDDGAPANGTTTGTAIANLADMQFQNDAEGAQLGLAFVGAIPTTWGVAWYSTNGGTTWTNLSAASTSFSLSSALVLDRTARLYFQGNANAAGTLGTAPIRLWDGTVPATSGSMVDISTLAGATGAYSPSNSSLKFELRSVNDTPVNTLPAGPVITSPNTAKVITGLQISDVDAGTINMTITLAVSSGTLAVLSGTGVTVTGSGTSSVTLTGGLSSLNTLLATTNAVTYTPTTGFIGSATLTMTANDNNTVPSNGLQTDTDTLTISVLQEQVTVAITSISTDSGIAGDRITNDKTPNISGTSDKPNRPLTLTIAGVTFTVMTDGSGNWSVDTGALTPTSGTYDKTVGFSDGLKAITVSLSGTQGGTGTASSDVTIDTSAPTVLVTSVFGDGVGDAVGEPRNGIFYLDERGFNTTNYTLSATVPNPLPVISGTTTAEDGQTVTVTLNGKTYTATVSAGAWSVSVPSADAVLLNHGNTYAITANVSDKAGNAALADTNNGVLVNIAPPDVPTVVSQSTTSTTPTITGLAQKLNSTTTINLAANDAITVVIKDATGTTTLASYTLTVGGTSSPTGLTYNTGTGVWSLAVPAGLNLAAGSTYQVDVSATAASLTRSDISSSELKIVAPPTITSIAEATNSLNMTETASDGGTPVVVGLADTGAVAGQVITVTWGGQTFTQVLTAADIAANTVTVVVPTATIQAETPVNTSETIAVTVSLGGTVTSTATNVTVNFIQPGAPTISSTLWSTTATTSSTSGIPEARYSWSYATFPTSPSGIPDNKLYYSEAISAADSGTLVRVQLPLGTGAVNPPAQGDTLTLNWGNQVINVGALTAANITAKYVDVVVPFATIDSQPFGDVTVTAALTSATSGNTSAPATVIVDWSFDLPLNNMAAMSSGFAINGLAGTSMTGYVTNAQGVIDVGDVNGDGYDDFSIVDLYSNHYIVYGKAGLTTVEMSSLTAAGNTNGFTFNSVAYYNGPAGDLNGDGLNDVVMQNTSTTAYVVLGNTRSPGTLTPSNFAASSAGYTITSPVNNFAGISVMGDVNGDGFDDLLLNFYVVGGAVAYSSFLLYGSANKTNITLPTGSTGTYSNGFFINTNNAFLTNAPTLVSATGDFNGDGYADILLSNHVYFGGPNLTGVSSSALSAAGSGRGFAIQGITTTASSHVYATTGGDINGDGLDDILINDGMNVAYAIFGKTSDAPVNVSSLASTGAGFALNPGTRPGPLNNDITDVDLIGDFNGDGLADILVSEFNVPLNSTGAIGLAYLVYGRTGSTPISLTDLAASEGFRINGISPNAYSGYSVSAAGDVNGDGFADLLVASPMDDPVTGTRTDAGITRVVYGGVTRINDMVFQPLNGDAIGTTGADTLTGTSGPNQLVAGDGNDTLIGAGGADVLYGGRGNDVIQINASNITALGNNINASQDIARIDGGNGVDTIKLDGSGLMLDLTAIRGAVISNIEKVDLTGSGDNTLKLTLADVLQSATSSNVFNAGNTTSGLAATVAKNQLMVDGNAGDKVVLSDLANWTAAGTNVVGYGHTYVVYNHNTSALQLLIDQLITTSVI